VEGSGGSRGSVQGQAEGRGMTGRNRLAEEERQQREASDTPRSV
jgi:hypothetical protein